VLYGNIDFLEKLIAVGKIIYLLLTTGLHLEPGDSNPHPHNRFLWSILILSFSLHVMFLSCSLKKSCVLVLLLVGTRIDGSGLCLFFRLTHS